MLRGPTCILPGTESGSWLGRLCECYHDEHFKFFYSYSRNHQFDDVRYECSDQHSGGTKSQHGEWVPMHVGMDVSGLLLLRALLQP